MRSEFPVAERRGHVRIPADVFADQHFDDAALHEGATYVKTDRTPALRGYLACRTEWTVERGDGGTTVSERVSYGRPWYGLVLAGLVVLLLGRTAAVSAGSPPSAFLTALGSLPLLLATGVATPTGSLPRRQISLETLRYPQFTVLCPVWAGSAVATAVGGPVGAVVAAGLVIGWLVHGQTDRLARLLPVDAVSTLCWRLPDVPTRYVLTVTVATVALSVFGAANTTVRFDRPALTFVAFLLTAAAVVGILASIRSRRRARVGAVAAAAISGLFVVSLPLGATVAVRPLVVDSAVDHAMLAATAGVLVTGWVVLWRALFSTRERIQAEFLDSGRGITTRQAAVVAYLMITTAGSFLCVVLASAALWWFLSGRAVPISVGLLGVSLALPAGYLVAGSLYQLVRLGQTVWTIRTESDRDHGLADRKLPFDPVRPVWVLPREEFYAGAYWDPLGGAVVLSAGAVEALTDAELAAIVAHEESHFEYRGAQLQFAFALLPAFALMGKNVVYSIYDFHEREMTADAYAVRRLDRASTATDGTDALVGVLQRFLLEEVELHQGSVLTFLPTLTVSEAARTVGDGIDGLFTVFHGHFAGEVHPSNDERISRLRRRAAAEERLDPEERLDE